MSANPADASHNARLGGRSVLDPREQVQHALHGGYASGEKVLRALHERSASSKVGCDSLKPLLLELDIRLFTQVDVLLWV